MTIFLNGQFVPEAQAVVSVFDRSFLYGDGLFETMLVANGQPFRWAQHLDRLQRGAAFLGIKIPFPPEGLARFASELIAQNKLPEALLRLTLSRGVGRRGYSPKGADTPTLVMTMHPPPLPTSDHPLPGGQKGGNLLRWRAHTASVRLPAGEPLAQFKTCNKLAQILARAEAEAAGADESLILNTDGFVVEAASSNFFWIQRGEIGTPPLASGILAGVTREVIGELCARLKLTIREANPRPTELIQVDAAFLSLSSHGIIELGEINGTKLRSSPITRQLATAYTQLVRAECGG